MFYIIVLTILIDYFLKSQFNIDLNFHKFLDLNARDKYLNTIRYTGLYIEPSHASVAIFLTSQSLIYLNRFSIFKLILAIFSFFLIKSVLGLIFVTYILFFYFVKNKNKTFYFLLAITILPLLIFYFNLSFIEDTFFIGNRFEKIFNFTDASLVHRVSSLKFEQISILNFLVGMKNGIAIWIFKFIFTFGFLLSLYFIYILMREK